MMAVEQAEGRKATGSRRGEARRRGLAAVAGSLIAATAIAALGWFGGLRFNLTPSEPIGLWRIVPLDRPVAVGDLVFVCPPPGPITAFGRERGYFRWGSCPAGVAPLIKTVAALADARVDVGAEVEIDGVALSQSEISSRDGAGRPLTTWPGGIVPAGQIFLHSPFAGSYDSRYFGPVPLSGLLGLARTVHIIDP